MDPVPIRFGSVEYQLTLPTSAVREFERLMGGRGIFECGIGVNFSNTVTLLYCMAKPLAKNKNLSLEHIFALVQPRDLKRVGECVNEVAKRAFGVADEPDEGAEKEARPLDCSNASGG